jgi:hypothetical protein
MLSVDDVAAQVRDSLTKNPHQTWEELGANIGRPAAFTQAICKMKGIKLGEPLEPPPKVYKIRHMVKKKYASQNPSAVLVGDIDYCGKLLEFRTWIKDKDFSLKLGIIFAITNFMDHVDKVGGWECNADLVNSKVKKFNQRAKGPSGPTTHKTSNNRSSVRIAVGVHPNSERETSSPFTNGCEEAQSDSPTSGIRPSETESTSIIDEDNLEDDILRRSSEAFKKILDSRQIGQVEQTG